MNYPQEYTRKEYDPAKNPLPYVKGGRFSLIVFSVVLIHILFAVLPYFVLKIADFFNPPLTVEKVSLVETPPADTSSPLPSHTPSAPAKKKIIQEKIPDIPAFPDIPDIPEEVTAEKIPPAQQVPEKAVKKIPAKVAPVPAKKKKRFTSPENIRISTKKVKNPRNKTTAQRYDDANKQRSEKIRKLLADYNKNNNSSSNAPLRGSSDKGFSGGGGTPGVSGNELQKYYEKVRLTLMRSWKQPNRAQLNNRKPEVLLMIHVDASGRVISAKITKRSGNYAMDKSVEQMLEKVTVLPKPPKEMNFTVNVNIEQ